MLMKLNFVKLFKGRKFKKKMKRKKKNKRDTQKKSKKCYIYEKVKHFIKNCKSTNMMNWSQLNILRTIFVKKEFKEICNNDINILKIITKKSTIN